MDNSIKFLYQVSKKEINYSDVGIKPIPMRSKPLVKLITPVTLPWSISWQTTLIEPRSVDPQWYWKYLASPVLR